MSACLHAVSIYLTFTGDLSFKKTNNERMRFQDYAVHTYVRTYGVDTAAIWLGLDDLTDNDRANENLYITRLNNAH